MRNLLLLSMKRSGTNYFMDLVGRLPSFLCTREMFNPDGVFGINARGGVVAQAISQRMGKEDIDERDPELISFAGENQLELFDLARDASRDAGFEWWGVTVFDTQLDASSLEEMMNRPDTYVVILKRRTLPRAISLKKARVAGAWKRLDTTSIKPEVTLREIEREHRAGTEWYGFVERLVDKTGCRSVSLTYEEDIACSADHVLGRLREYHPGFPWSSGQHVPVSSFHVQDKGTDVFDRISNGRQLLQAANENSDVAALFGYPGCSSR